MRPTIVVEDENYSSDDDIATQLKAESDQSPLNDADMEIRNVSGCNEFREHVKKNIAGELRRHRSNTHPHKRASPVVDQRICFDPSWTSNLTQMQCERAHPLSRESCLHINRQDDSPCSSTPSTLKPIMMAKTNTVHREPTKNRQYLQ